MCSQQTVYTSLNYRYGIADYGFFSKLCSIKFCLKIFNDNNLSFNCYKFINIEITELGCTSINLNLKDILDICIQLFCTKISSCTY